MLDCDKIAFTITIHALLREFTAFTVCIFHSLHCEKFRVRVFDRLE